MSRSSRPGTRRASGCWPSLRPQPIDTDLNYSRGLPSEAGVEVNEQMDGEPVQRRRLHLDIDPPDRLRLAQRAIRRSHRVGGAQVLHHRSAHLGLRRAARLNHYLHH